MADPNFGLLTAMAVRLGDLLSEFVLLGGCTVGLFITDDASAYIRPTKDVDGIVEATTYLEYNQIEQEIASLGFNRSMNGPICRWEIDGMLLDVLPVKGDFLGFNSRWFDMAVATADVRELGPNLKVRVINPIYFIATKLEAFGDRGGRDFLGSRDLEDILTVVNGRKELMGEVSASDRSVREFIIGSFAALLGESRFIESIPGHLNPDPERTVIVLDRLRKIVSE